MKKSPPLQLVPFTGRKLADVADNLQLQAALCSTLLSVIVQDRPEIKDKMILKVRRLLTRADLSPREREVYGAALQIIKDLVVTPG